MMRNSDVVSFGPWELDLDLGELRRGGDAVDIQPLPLKVLTTLIEGRGKLVERQAIQEQVWGSNPIVDVDRCLNHCIKKIRQVLGDNPRNPEYVQTVPRRGYRFIAPLPARPASWTEDPKEPAPRSYPSSGSNTAALEISNDRRAVTLAVGEFSDLTADTHASNFAKGMVEELIYELVQLRSSGLAVIDSAGAGASSAADGPDADQPAFLLRGSIRQVGHKVRTHAHLIQLSDNAHIDTTMFDEELGGLLELQRQAARRIKSDLILPLVQGAPFDSD